MTTTSTKIDAQIALYYNQGGSDKIWAAALEGAKLHVRWGKRGATPQGGTKECGTPEKARKQYEAKLTEKMKEGYVKIAFDTPEFGVVSFGEGGVSDVSAVAGPKPVKYASSHLLPLTSEELDEAIENERYGLTEKVNGRRRLIEHDPVTRTMTGYNRTGQALPGGVPTAVLPMALTGRQFVIDGEAMEGEAITGGYVVFDLLELDGNDMRQEAFHTRIDELYALLDDSDEIFNWFCYSEYVSTLASGAIPPGGLVLLKPQSRPLGKRELVASVAAAGGEGIIVRDMEAPYQTGDTRYTRKFKFRTTIDCEILYIKPGIGAGSVGLGLTRPSDGAVIELSTARGGLKDADVLEIAAMLARGWRPVIEVEYLPIRSPGLALVEPTLYMKDLRTDKTAGECTTDQFGPEKAAIVAAARPWSRL